jgi:hypothetical protein
MKKGLLVLLLCLLTVFANARKFYFSGAGNDSYTTTEAQNQATPWKTLAKLNSLSSIAAAGDTFAFKRGETFANGSQTGNYTTIASVKWFGNGYEIGLYFPSGTAQNPIVFTYYGDMSLERPNLLYPSPSSNNGNEKGVLGFANVSYIVIDGLQFNDYRFPVNDKRSGAYTCTGLWFGDSGYCYDSETCKCSNITIKNCNFSNTAYGIVCFFNGAEITNNTFSNFKSTGYVTDTIGNNDIGADPVLCSGNRIRITNNKITGSWAYANPASSSTGLLGGALETINDFDNCFIAYNTFIDCSGGMEYGVSRRGGLKGPNDDTICYNKFINCSNITYLNTSGDFATQGKNLRFWNNFFVEGSRSRMTGRSADNGGDALGEGQTYTSTGFIFYPPFPLNKSIRYPATMIWQGLTIQINSQNAWRPIAMGADAQVADTVFDIRNNVFWINNGLYAKYAPSDRSKIFYRNNVYHLVDGYKNPNDDQNRFVTTSLGPNTILDPGEIILNGKFIVDSSSVFPQNWDMHIISDTCYVVGRGSNVGLTRDFEGNPVSSTPTIGIYEFKLTSRVVSLSNVTCKTANDGAVTVAATGGTAPYKYRINNLSYRTSPIFSGLAPNTYVITIKDATGKLSKLNVTIRGSKTVCP